MSNYGPSQYGRYAKLGTICMTSSDTLISNQKYFPLSSKENKIYPSFYSSFPNRNFAKADLEKMSTRPQKEGCCGR